ncbi:MAG: DUF1893 domain-containing protein [Alistipes shahii]
MPVRRRDRRGDAPRRRTVRILKRQTAKRNTTFLTDDQRLQLIDLLHVEACSCVIRNGDSTRIFRERGVADLFRLQRRRAATAAGRFHRGQGRRQRRRGADGTGRRRQSFSPTW